MATCKRGHVGAPRNKSGNCLECASIVNREWREQNRDKKRATNKAWAAANPEKVQASSRKWHAANKEAEGASNRARYLANPEKVHESNRRWREANRERSLAAGRAWHKNNRDKSMANVHRRRARRVGARAGCRKAYAAFLRWARSESAIRCYWCGIKTRPGRTTRHVDHIVPLSAGGSDDVANLCVSCGTCNVSKGARMPEVFAGQSEIAF